jgi:hypothetical protein
MSLEDCEKYYLDKFRKLLFEKNFEYPEILTYRKKEDILDNDVIKINNYLVPYKHIQYFSLNYPVISVNQDGTFNRFYKLFNVGDKILIWSSNILFGHLCCQIITKSGYTFSFGMMGGGIYYKKKKKFNVTSASLNTPDAILEKSLFDKLLNPLKKDIKLVSISLLKKKQIDIINNHFDKIRFMDNYTILPKIINEKHFKQDNIEINKLKNQNLLEQIVLLRKQNYSNQITFDLIDQNINNKILFLQYYNYNIVDKFCLFSKKKNNTKNCTSFLQSLFDDIITCTGSSIVSIPRFCYQKKTAKRVNCFKVVSNTSRKKQKLI